MIVAAARSVAVPEEAQDGAPRVLRGHARAWPAFGKWSFDFLRARLGHVPVVLSDDVGRPQAHLKTSFARYADYAQGTGELATPPPGTSPWYLGNWNCFAEAPELAEDFEAPVEDRLQGWASSDPRWHHGRFGWLFVGPAGTRTFPHKDILSTHAWIAQIEGRKQVRLIPFEQEAEARAARRDAVDWAWDAVLEPGDVLLIPADMMHEAEALEPSISLSFNYVDETNEAAVRRAIADNPALWASKVAGVNMKVAA